MTLLSERTASTLFTCKYSRKEHADQNVSLRLWLVKVYFRSYNSPLLVIDELLESKNSEWSLDKRDRRNRGIIQNRELYKGIRHSKSLEIETEVAKVARVRSFPQKIKLAVSLASIQPYDHVTHTFPQRRNHSALQHR